MNGELPVWMPMWYVPGGNDVAGMSNFTQPGCRPALMEMTLLTPLSPDASQSSFACGSRGCCERGRLLRRLAVWLACKREDLNKDVLAFA